MKFKKYILLGVVLTLLNMVGCSFSVENENVEMYSRADTKYICDSNSFGKGRNDDVYTALLYIYSEKTIEEKHGTDFEITANDIVCHTSEGKSFFFVGLYEGYAEYTFNIANCAYDIKLNKKPIGVWTVTEFNSK